ncbi:ATP-binding cassette domain-containing protein [Secundilactobacillus collinoides]|uniref:ABC-type multidrug transport system, ATPase component n=2 Tax=Secundilactobacillus collinoides TaxID=33960 RepID=A0A0R2BC24_SECCO|nr:ATP-binding cassette domain-containing protein [Secundilactobacillus collinoides]KRM76341.1 ABC-type multidrug transport system, ATPase component [Secundilactobacillus collinoides DSM 20515 = JCM 1123]KZL41756.1 ABC transporter ATP-binding protein [Secundilactobacillus collinoides]
MNQDYAVQVTHLTKKFKDKVAVDDVSFNIYRGEVFGLLGPNGAGKTTTLRMMTTLLKATSGHVTIFGHDVAKESSAARAMFGLTGQYASVDEDISARENLMIFSRLNGLSRAEAKQRTTELLTEFSLLESADKTISDFSGGMRRRLDLAVSLITRPALIFLDEPTTGLDPRTRTQMWETIRKLVAEGSTIVLTTQYLDEADELADRIAVIDHGKLVKIGTPASLKEQVSQSKLSLSVADSNQVTEAKDIVTTHLKSATLIDQTTILAPFDDSNRLTDILMDLRAKQISVSHLSVQEPTLDDVFLNLTAPTHN